MWERVRETSGVRVQNLGAAGPNTDVKGGPDGYSKARARGVHPVLLLQIGRMCRDHKSQWAVTAISIILCSSKILKRPECRRRVAREVKVMTSQSSKKKIPGTFPTALEHWIFSAQE